MCFDHVKETFQDKGWEYGQDGHFDNEVVPLLTEFGDYRVVFFKWDPNTGECWFELRDEARRSVVYVRGVENIPTPEKSGALLESYGAPVKAMPNPKERPLYELPLAPVLKAGCTGSTQALLRCLIRAARLRKRASEPALSSS